MNENQRLIAWGAAAVIGGMLLFPPYEHTDIVNIIIRQLNPYLSKLETMINKEIPISDLYLGSDVYDDIADDYMTICNIPNTTDSLIFNECEMKDKNKRLCITVAKTEIGNGPVTVDEKADIATIEYEGLIASDS